MAFKMRGFSGFKKGHTDPKKKKSASTDATYKRGKNETQAEYLERTKARREAGGGSQKTNVKSADGKYEEYPMTMGVMDQITRQHDIKHRPKSDEDAHIRDTKLYRQKAILTDEEIANRKAKQLRGKKMSTLGK
tara:strand:+ start:49 stop:450 length:402 start_codon:yes stop_codon:yes gene_type:complete